MNNVFQSAETIEPATGRAGVAVSWSMGPLGMHSRIGMVQNIDLGFRYGFLNHFMIDGKYQFLREPIDASIDLGFSYNRVNVGDKENTNYQISRGFSPTILIGKTSEDVGWYAGLRAIYVSRGGYEEFLIMRSTLFGDSGWIAKGFVLGGFVHGGGSVRFVQEINFLYGRNGRTAFVPTIGLQFDMNK